MKRLWNWMKATWAYRHTHEYDLYGECECGKLNGDW